MKTSLVLALLPFATAKTFGVQPQVSAALNVRGGGVFGTPVTESNLVDLFTVLCASHGLVAMAVPEKMPDIFYNGKFSVKDAFANQITGFLGSALTSVAMVAYLTKNTSLSFSKVLAYAQIPCIYGFFGDVLQGKFAGWNKGVGLGGLLVPVVMVWGILTGNIDSDLCVKVLIAVPIVMGAIGYVSSDLNSKINGFAKPTGVADTMLKWWAETGLFYGALTYSLYKGKSLNEAVGLSALVFLVGVLDGNHIRKFNSVCNLPKEQTIFFALVLSIIAGGLLIKD